MKKCCRCKTFKAVSEFYKNKSKPGGICRACKICESNRQKQDYRKHHPIHLKKSPEEIKEQNARRTRKWRQGNPEKAKEHSRNYRKKHRKQKAESDKLYVRQNYEKVKMRQQNYREKNKTKIAEYDRNYRKIHPYKTRSSAHRLSQSIRCSIKHSLRGYIKTSHTLDMLGYSIKQLKAHLQKQFRFGMTWDNYGQWQIDHIIPVSAFNFDSPEDMDFKRCWALKNLQPMWAKENRCKSAKVLRPFQPYLKLKIGT